MNGIKSTYIFHKRRHSFPADRDRSLERHIDRHLYTEDCRSLQQQQQQQQQHQQGVEITFHSIRWSKNKQKLYFSQMHKKIANLFRRK